jgi:hypothetical protein
MRASQLKAIGLKTNEKGQVKAESSLLQVTGMNILGEDSCDVIEVALMH